MTLGPAITRRLLLASTAAVSLLRPSCLSAAAQPRRIEPFPIDAVRLKSSIYLNAVQTNQRYLKFLEPDRLLHNFRAGAGLTPNGEMYGGWEGRGIAGHTLGHYLSACSLMHAQTGDEEPLHRVNYIVDELAECQEARGTGYVGGTTVERDGKIVDGEIIFEELRRGDVRAGPFDLNGGWVPLYTFHKVHAGLLDAHRLCRNEKALQVAVKLGDFLIDVFRNLGDAQVQQVLSCEHGGLNESFAETFAQTGEPRFLAMAERLHHDAILVPLEDERDELAGQHANTQIPKLIGLARLYELTGRARYGVGSKFFWQAVTANHSFVIGGNSEREHFLPPGVVSAGLSDRTCEHCNSYNMLKLTRHMFSREPDSSYFDYYERTHLNHIMAQQHPETGMFCYFMPMMSCVPRRHSTPTESFWCCVGSGMESHAKHGDSIYWHDGDTLYVNLFIPSELDWKARDARFVLESDFPQPGPMKLRVAKAGGAHSVAIAIRVPDWTQKPVFTINGGTVSVSMRRGYARLSRRWRDGDIIAFDYPMALRRLPAPDDTHLSAFLSGPVVLAANLGTGDGPPNAIKPAFVDAVPALVPNTSAGPHLFTSVGLKPQEMTFGPFFALHDHRTGIYLEELSGGAWAEREATFARSQIEKMALDARTIDLLLPGLEASERAHALATNQSDVVAYEGRAGRQVWWGEGNFITFEMTVQPGAAQSLHLLFWGEDRDKKFAVIADGTLLANETLAGAAAREFVAKTYRLPARLFGGSRRVAVRLETHGTDATLYEARILSG